MSTPPIGNCGTCARALDWVAVGAKDLPYRLGLSTMTCTITFSVQEQLRFNNELRALMTSEWTNDDMHDCCCNVIARHVIALSQRAPDSQLYD